MALRVAEVARPEISFAPNGHHPKPPKPHHADCPTQSYLDKQAILFAWNRERYHDWDYSDRLFQKTFGEKHVPTCTCAHRQVESNSNIVPLPFREMPQPFLLHFQKDITAPIVGSLRHRLALMLATESGDFTFHFQDLGDPITHAPGIEHAAGRTARGVIRNLRAFEEHAQQNLRRRHSSSSDGPPAAARSAK
jgi:hypothetical protein